MVGERVGGLLRTLRSYYAIVPLAIPLVVAGIQNPADRHTPPAIALPMRIDYRVPEPQPVPLPSHTSYAVIQPGDTLDSILRAGGVPREESARLVPDLAESIDARRLKPGEPVRFTYDANGIVQRVELKVTGWGRVAAARERTGFAVRAEEFEKRSEEILASATIATSLYEAVCGSGESPQLVQQLVDVFQWDVDFFRLREGDSLSVVVMKEFAGEDHLGYGPIEAARLEHDGKTFEAFRFGDGYYTRSGAPVRKQFLKAPLKFSRITSGFSKKRFHPVLQRFRPHNGVDYGAPTGTPVRSTADGVVGFAGFGRGEGNYVKIRHNSRIETAYLHLSKFAKGIRRGTKVKQGEVIGYVGGTGLATAPHLDYRVSEGGKWINPLKLKSLTADPLHGARLTQFKASVVRHLTRLDNPSRVAAQHADSERALF